MLTRVRHTTHGLLDHLFQDSRVTEKKKRSTWLLARRRRIVHVRFLLGLVVEAALQVQGLGFRDSLGFRVEGLGFGVEALRLRVWG